MNPKRANFALCGHATIDAFLDERLPADQIVGFELHLNQCSECRSELEERTATQTAWQAAAAMLNQFEYEPDPFLEHDISKHSSCDMIEAVLQALCPSDNPQRLGRLGQYEIIGVVGAGAMGVVLKANDTTLDRVVSIKVLSPNLANNGTSRQRFEREAKAAAAVLHPNVIPIHGVASNETLPYLVMSYIKGGSLKKRIDEQGPFRTDEILRIGAQIAAGLSAAHQQGLVHRDIKPANIMLEQGVERVTITDFGLARAVDDDSITQFGVIAGTPKYMSPEQSRGELVDPMSDLFSLGSVLYSMATGRPPFRAETIYGVMRKICDETPSDIGELNPSIPEWLCRFIEKLMAKRKAERFASAAAVSDLLSAALAHVQQPTSVQLPNEISTLVEKRKRPVFVLGGIIVTALLLVLTANFFSPLLGGDDYVERDNQSKYIQHLLSNWKQQAPGTHEFRQMKAQIAEFHEQQASEPGSDRFFKTKRKWANELLPILLAGVAEEHALFLAEFTKPFAEITKSDQAAVDGKVTEPVGWEWQEIQMLAYGRTQMHGNAYEISDRLIRKIEVNLKSDENARADFFGKNRSLKEILRECLVHRRLIEAINGPSIPGPADGAPEYDPDPESREQMDRIKIELGRKPDTNDADSRQFQIESNPAVQKALDEISDRPSLLQADEKFVAIFEVDGDDLVSKAIRDEQAGELAIHSWQRIKALFPKLCRRGLVQFNVMKGRQRAGYFAGSGKNNVGKKGYSLAIAKYRIAEQSRFDDPNRALTPRRGTLDWTTVHEMGHYICLTTNAIELFSAKFEDPDGPKPKRRKRPDDYPEDGSPKLNGSFVTSYAERSPVDEEVCETFTTYLLVKDLPDNESLVSEKIRFFDDLPGYPELRAHIQKFGVEQP